MRDIRFRGLSINSKQWVYGDYTRLVLGGNIHYYIKPLDSKVVEVEYESIGQLTGIKDKNEKDVFEGDILQGYKCHYPVKYEHASFTWNDEFLGYTIEADYDAHVEIIPDGCETLEIIGNIHENSNLITK